MKMSKKFRAIASAALISAMVMSMNGMTAFAAQVSKDSDGKIPVIKSVTIDESNVTLAPDETFIFAVENGSETPDKIKDDNQKEWVVYQGVTGGLKFATGENDAPFDSTMATVSEATYQSREAKLTVDANVFSSPGIYHYEVSEVIPDDANKYKGIVYTSKKYDVYLFVEFNESTTDEGVTTITKNVTGIIAYANENGTRATDKSSELEFINDYGKDNNTTHDLIITKIVSGNQGDKNKSFSISVSVKGDVAEGKLEQYVVVVDKDGDPRTNDDITKSRLSSNDNSESYEVINGGTIHVYGLTADDEVTVNEASYGDDGYTVTYTSSADTTDKSYDYDKDGLEESITVKAKSDGTTVTVTNTKNVGPATGIIMSFAPYILVLALAGVFAVLFLRKRREEF